jgi:hypothetical protein
MQLFHDKSDPMIILKINFQKDENVYKWKLHFRYKDKRTNDKYYLEFYAKV